MKSLHVINRIYPEFSGGTEIHVYDLCRAMAKNGENVVIFTQQTVPGDSITTQKKILDGIKQYTLRVPPLTSKIILIKNIFLKEFKLVRYFIETVRKEKPDVVHFHHLIDLTHWMPIYCWFKKIPYCVDLVDYWFICPDLYLTCKGNLTTCATICTWREPKTIIEVLIDGIGIKSLKVFYGFLKVSFHRILWKTILNHFGAVLVPISERTKNIFRDNGFTGPMVIKPCGIGVKGGQAKGTVRHTLNIGFIGAILPVKGINTLLAAFKTIKNRNITLSLYGEDGYPKGVLPSLIDRDFRIKLCGSFDHSQLVKIISSIDLLVVPSVWEETFGIVVSEGQAAGIPVICSAIGGMKERVIDGVNGFTFKAGNTIDLAKIIRKITKYHKTIKSHLKLATAIFKLDNESDQLVQIYSALLNHKVLPNYLFSKKTNRWIISK